MDLLKNIIYPIIILLFTGCLETIEINTDDEQVLCINSLVSAGKPIEVNISHTWTYTDGLNNDKSKVDDAVITVFANDKQVNSDYIPIEGDKIRIMAESKKYGKAEVEVLVPYKSPLEPIEWKTSSVKEYDLDMENKINKRIKFNLSLLLEIKDVKETYDYYRITFQPYTKMDEIYDNLPDTIISPDPYIYFNDGNLRYEAEPLFYEHMGEWGNLFETDPQGFPFFTDQTFSGSNYILNLQFSDCVYYLSTNKFDSEYLDCGLIVSLHSISESYYEWEKYRFSSNESIVGDIFDWGFREPQWGFSNVSTGAGVVAAESVTTYKLNLKDFLEKYF